MGLDFLSKLKKGKGNSGAKTGAEEGAPKGAFKPDPRKAEAFFRHAEANSDSRNYEYSIECYINGLRHDPDNMVRHEELREVAKKRKVSGGKPAGIAEKLKTGGSSAIDKMLQCEKLWSMDPVNIANAIKTTEFAVRASAESQLNLGEVGYWIGDTAMAMINATKKPDKRMYLQLCDLFAEIPAYDKAVEACRLAMAVDPNDDELDKRLKDLEVEHTLQEEHYGSGKEGGFRENIKDADRQRALEEDDAITKTESVIESTIRRRRQEFEENTEDLDLLNKLVSALLSKGDEKTQNEAVELLTRAWTSTQQYKFKMQIGDIRMAQMRHGLRAARRAYESDRKRADAKKRFEDEQSKILQFELEEFTERVKNYPTDTRVRFELGRRYFASGKHDEAIAEFQRSRGDPKHRAMSCEYLGRCFVVRGWFDEAIDALRQGIEVHGTHDDRLGMSLRYLLMDALEKSARQTQNLDTASEAQKMASQILQTDINFKDIRTRMDQLKQLVAELQPKTSG